MKNAIRPFSAALALVSCAGADAPPSAPQPPATAPSAEPPSAPGPGPAAVLTLGSPQPGSLSTGTARTLEELTAYPNLIPHPGSSETLQLCTTPYGLSMLAVGFDEQDGQWTVSADLDADGTLAETERAALRPSEAGTVAGQLEGHLARGEDSVPVTLQASTHSVDGTRVFGLSTESSRAGTLPGDIAFHAFSHGGLYDHPKARVVVDEDGDGKVDFANRLVAFDVGEGLLEARGQRWTLSLSPDGSTLTLEPSAAPPTGLRAGHPAPPFSVLASDGETHELARYAGAPLLIDFWATWCAPCIALHPEVEALAERQGLAVLGISANETQAEVDRWLKKNPTPWPTAAIGPTGEANLAYGVNAWPSHALIDAEGKLIVLGSFDAVRQALGEAPLPSPPTE